MSDMKENSVASEQKEWKTENGEWIWPYLTLMFVFGGFGSYGNPKISELEKKVARLEGQMSMIGGKRIE